MPVIKMTDRAVKATKAPTIGQVDYFDQSLPGFGLRVSYGGRKAWILLYRRGQMKRRMTLGTYPSLSLSKARERANGVLRDVALGKDPAMDKAAHRKSETVADLAREYLENHAKKKKRSWRHDERTLRNDVLPDVGGLKAKDVTRRDIIRMLNKVEKRSPIMANRTLEIVRKMFNWGISQSIVDANPCLGIERPAEERQRDRVLSADEIHRFWTAAEAEESQAGLVLLLLLVTAQREGEVLKMRWADIEHRPQSWWTIPGEIAKNGLPHRVPLSSLAVKLLKAAQERHPNSPYVFPRRGGGGPATGSLVRKPVQRSRQAAQLEDFVPHDLRRTAASNMTGMGIARLTVGKVLNHAEQGVTKVYDRHSYDAEKRHALNVWAARVDEIVTGQPTLAGDGKVVALR